MQIPFIQKISLRNIVTKSIKKITGINTIEDTGGGTSDGRFMHPHGAEVVELDQSMPQSTKLMST